MIAPAIAPTSTAPLHPAPLLGSASSGLGGSGRLADAAVTLLTSPRLTSYSSLDGSNGRVNASHRASGVVSEPAARFGSCWAERLRALHARLSLVLSDDTACESAFLVVLRQRRVAALLRGTWPYTLRDAPALLRIEAAPKPLDIHWANLLRSRWWRRTRALAGVALSLSLYLFWTIPVSIAQALASLQSLSQIAWLRWLCYFVEALGPAIVAQVQTQLSSLVLAAFRYLTLSSGLFQLLVRMEGATRQTQISSRAAGRMMLFQLCARRGRRRAMSRASSCPHLSAPLNLTHLNIIRG